MKIQIRHASAHQNGKVLGILMAATSLLFVIPMFLLFQLAPTQVDAQGNPIVIPGFLILLFPLMYLVMGYIGGAIGSLCYNVIVRFAGGFEFELNDLA